MSNARFAQVPTWWQQENFKEFVNVYSQCSRPLFFVGSGLSRWAELPDWADLLHQLARHDTPEVQEQVKSLIHDKKFTGYQAAGSLLKRSLGEGLWHQSLTNIFTNPKLTTQRSDIHDALVSLKWQRIITTNYDPLLEIASARMNLAVKTLHYASPELPSSEKDDDRCIIHLHGDARDRSSSLILAKEDYDNLYHANGAHYYYERTIGGTLRRAQVILFLGYSHDDEYVASLFDRSFEGISNAPVFALVPRREKQANFEVLLNDLSQRHRIRYISFSRGQKYSELLDILKYLRAPDRYNSAFETRLSIKRPTVVFLRGGGTIGAKSRPAEDGHNLDIDHVESRFDEDLQHLSEMVTKRHQSHSDIPIEIVWEILPPEQQLLSENATVGDWNNVVHKLQSCFLKYFDAPDKVGPSARIHDPEVHSLFLEECKQYKLVFPKEELSDLDFMDGFRNRYILGFVLLYGTDTLAFLAPAIAFALQHIPCSVIITGANQPLFSRHFAGSSDDSSDGWRNLLNSIFFLQSFGHRLTEFFVVFGDTIHHAVNLRKRAIDIIPYDREQIQQSDLEPFIYRNLSLTGQYMFRLIDEIFCNNYYAATTKDYHRLLRLDGLEKDDLWHFRQDPFAGNQSSAIFFSDCVKYLDLSPAFPRIDVSTMLQDESEIRAILVEGYNSGTYPSTSAHNFAHVLAELERQGIPVVLVSRFGIRATQEEYRATEVEGKSVQVLRLYGMIVETALPLLSLVVGRIKTQEWNNCERREDLADHRRQLIRKALDQFFDTRKNILSEELRYSTNRADRFQRMTELRDREEKHKNIRDRRDGSLWRPTKRRTATSTTAFKNEFVVIPRADFLDMLEDSIDNLERVGALPDGFLTLDNQGFELGNFLANDFKERNHQQEYLITEREHLLHEAEALLENVTGRLQRSGIAEIELSSVEFGKTRFGGRSFFTFEAKVSRGEPAGRLDGRYSATTFSDEESEFFEMMLRGCSPDFRLESQEAELRHLYKKSVNATWRHVTHHLDWFVVGFFKGICCVMASLLGFDHEPDAAQINPSVDQKRALRQSIQCQFIGYNLTRFGLRLRCFEQVAGYPIENERNTEQFDKK